MRVSKSEENRDVEAGQPYVAFNARVALGSLKGERIRLAKGSRATGVSYRLPRAAFPKPVPEGRVRPRGVVVGCHGNLIRWEWAKHGGQAARFETVSLPSWTAARVTATRCAPCGDHLIRRRFPIRVLPMSSTQPSARDDEAARPFRYRQP